MSLEDGLQSAFIFTALLGLAIYIYLAWHFNHWKNRGVDGPKPRLLLGSFPNAFTQKKAVVYDVDDIYRAYKGKERFVGVFMTRSPQLLIIDPKLVRDILVTKFKNFHDNDAAKWFDNKSDAIMSKNPFILTGDEWKEKRAEITPALSMLRIKASYPIMQEVCSKLTNYLKRRYETDGLKCVNAKEISAKFTAEVVANCIYGIEAGAFSDGDCPILEAGRNIMDVSIAAIMYMTALTVVPAIRKIYSRSFIPKKAETFFTNLMRDAIALREQNKSDRADFLNYLLELKAKKNLNDLDMAGHTLTFFLDGFETSSVVIAHFLLAVGRNKDIQKKLRDEIQRAENSEGGLTFEKLIELPYLEQVMNETLRLYSPLMFSSKSCTEPTEFVNSKDKRILIEKDDVMILPIYSFFHDPDYYPDPEKFDPERFSEENGGTKKYKDMGVYLPFMDGPRICLGMKFGMTQTKVAVVEIIRNFDITINEKTQKGNTLEPKNIMAALDGGIWIDMKPLN